LLGWVPGSNANSAFARSPRVGPSAALCLDFRRRGFRRGFGSAFCFVRCPSYGNGDRREVITRCL